MIGPASLLHSRHWLLCFLTLHDVSGSCEHTSYGTSLHSSLLVIVQSCSALQWLQVKNLLDVPPVLEQDCSRLWEQSGTAFLAPSHTSAPQRWRTSPLALPHTFVVERPCNPLWKEVAGANGDHLGTCLHDSFGTKLHCCLSTCSHSSLDWFHNKKRVGKRSPWNYLACIIGLLETLLPISKKVKKCS